MGSRFLEPSATDWTLSLRTARCLFWLPLVATAALCATSLVYGALGSEGRWLVRRAFEVVMSEDGPVEWMQVACFAAGCVAAGLIARRLFRSGRRRQAGLFALAALGLFFVVGEEISWGQRIVGVITPGWLADINDQDELNAHNITGVRAFLDYPRMLIAAWGVFGGLALRRLSASALPLTAPLFLAPAFATMLGYDLLRQTLWRESGVILQLIRYGEWPELSFAFGIGAFLTLGYRRLARSERESHELEAVERDAFETAA